MSYYPIIIVGAGISGMTAAIRLASKGIKTCLISQLPLRRTGALHKHEKMNIIFDESHQNDSFKLFINDTIAYGEFLANQKNVKGMCQKSGMIAGLLERMGVVFGRSHEGRLQLSKNEGSAYPRSLDAVASLSHQIRMVLTEQVRFFVQKGLIDVLECYDFMGGMFDNQQRCRGVMVRYLETMKTRVLKAEGVIVATGSIGALYGRHSLQSVSQTGSPISLLYQQGVGLANPEFVSFSPFSVKGFDKSYLISETVLEEGAKLWTLYQNEQFQFLDMWYPHQKHFSQNKLLQVIDRVQTEFESDEGIIPEIYLDLSVCEQSQSYLDQYKKLLTQEELSQKILPVKPAMSGWLGGLWTDDSFMTTTPGLFAVGQSCCHYHGANILPGNLIVASLHSGIEVTDHIEDYIKNIATSTEDLPEQIFEQASLTFESKYQEYQDLSGPENMHSLHQELSEAMYKGMGPMRHNAGIKSLLEKLAELKHRFQRVSLSDMNKYYNMEIVFARDLDAMIELSYTIALSALQREETRGVHVKKDMPDRDDANFLRTTKVLNEEGKPHIYYEDIDQSVLNVRNECHM